MPLPPRLFAIYNGLNVFSLYSASPNSAHGLRSSLKRLFLSAYPSLLPHRSHGNTTQLWARAFQEPVNIFSEKLYANESRRELKSSVSSLSSKGCVENVAPPVGHRDGLATSGPRRHRALRPDLEEQTYFYPKLKRLRSSSAYAPSDFLIDALLKSGRFHAIPHTAQTKPDLTHNRPHRWKARKANRGVEGPCSIQDRAATKDPYVFQFKPNLQSITASYIRTSHAQDLPISLPEGHDWLAKHSRLLGEVFDDRTMKLLSKKGYSKEDVAIWAWIITATSSEDAALQLLKACNWKRKTPYQAVPTFVLLFLLRRPQLSVSAIQYLLIHVADRVSRRHNPAFETPNSDEISSNDSQTEENKHLLSAQYNVLDSQTFIITVVRLIRQARQVWAAGLPRIAALFVRFFSAPTGGDRHLLSQEHSQRNFLYNRMLRLFGLPSNSVPYLSVPHLQRSQLQLLRQMSKHEPPLLLSRQGFRAVTLVQLSHRKSGSEGQWALMKTRSWPPWKQNKTGLDASIGVDHGISRAKQTLEKLNETGYTLREWGKAGSILSGWDTDHSPVIQTRIILEQSEGSSGGDQSGDLKKGADGPHTDSDEVWASRVRATRTLDEAWSVFLEYKDSDTSNTDAVYFAMAAKLVFDRYRINTEAHTGYLQPGMKSWSNGDESLHSWEATSPLPGDGLEVWPPPADPRERKYIRTQAPSLGSFLVSTVQDGIKFRGRFLTFLIKHATGLDECALVLENSRLRHESVLALLGAIPPSQANLRHIPPPVLAAYVEFLCRSKHILPPSFSITNLNAYGEYSYKSIDNQQIYAFSLVIAARPTHRLAWCHLIQALVSRSSKFKDDSHDMDNALQHLRIWQTFLQLLEEMHAIDVQLDWTAFTLVCVLYAKVARTALRIREQLTREVTDERLQSQTNVILVDGLALLKRAFRSLVSTGIDIRRPRALPMKPRNEVYTDSEVPVAEEITPQVLETPHPAHLHAFIRALGIARDFEGLRDVAGWMVQFEPEINAVKQESANGHSQMRRCLTALRIFLEGDWVRELLKDKNHLIDQRLDAGQAPAELIQEVFELIEEVDDWRGWPRDEDVINYFEHRGAPSHISRHG